MKFTCYKNDLMEALQIAIRSVAVKPMNPTLAGIYLNANDRYLEMQANNFSSAVIVKIPVNTEVSGEVVVVGKKFLDFIRNIPSETINFFGEDAASTFSLEADGAKAEFLTLPVMDFPKVKEPETDKSFKIRAIALKELIRSTAFATSKNDERPVFRGCLFELSGDKVTVVATDTYRIAICNGIVRENYEDGSFIVPADILRGVVSYIDPSDVENYIEIKYSSRQVTFRFNNVYLTARQIEGEFPPYDHLLDDRDRTAIVEVNKVELRTAIEFVAPMAKETENNAVRFDVMADCMNISADSTESGTASQTIETNMEGDRLQIAFNIDYFIDAMRTMDSQRMTLEFKDPNRTVAIREVGRENFVYLVTPVRF